MYIRFRTSRTEKSVVGQDAISSPGVRVPGDLIRTTGSRDLAFYDPARRIAPRGDHGAVIQRCRHMPIRHVVLEGMIPNRIVLPCTSYAKVAPNAVIFSTQGGGDADRHRTQRRIPLQRGGGGAGAGVSGCVSCQAWCPEYRGLTQRCHWLLHQTPCRQSRVLVRSKSAAHIAFALAGEVELTHGVARVLIRVGGPALLQGPPPPANPGTHA